MNSESGVSKRRVLALSLIGLLILPLALQGGGGLPKSLLLDEQGCTFTVGFMGSAIQHVGLSFFTSSDAATTINHALSNLPNSGGTVCLLPARYTISTSLLVYGNGTRLVGLGHAGILGINSTGSNSGVFLILGNSVNADLIKVGNPSVANAQSLSVEDVWIDNLSIDGNKASNTAGNGINGTTWSGGGITRMTIHNFAKAGITFSQNTAHGTGCCRDISDNTIEFNNGDGLTLIYTVYDFVHHNHFELDSGHCINIVGNDERVESNNLLHCGHGGAAGNKGIWIQSKEDIVTNNYLENCASVCISLGGSFDTVSGNHIQHASGDFARSFDGIQLRGDTKDVVTGNVVEDTYPTPTTHVGIEETNGATGNAVTFNVVGAGTQAAYSTAATSTSYWFGNLPIPATIAITIGASPFTYTNGNPYVVIVMVNNLNGLTALTYQGQNANPVVGIPYWLITGQSMVFTWAVTAPGVSGFPQ